MIIAVRSNMPSFKAVEFQPGFAVRSNMPSFKAVEFQPGFNVVLADRTKESTRRDSRNGLGKTTLIEIIHFCCGAQTRRNQGLMVPSLKGWSFTLEMRIGDRELVVTRSTDEPRWISLDGDVRGLNGLNGSSELRWIPKFGQVAKRESRS